jgi:S-layer protein
MHLKEKIMAVTAQNRIDVSNLYVSLFGRAPDGEGLGFWANKLGDGASVTSVANEMFATAPARSFFPSFQTSSETIASFYVNVLGRPADAEGLAFWTAQLNATGATFGSVISNMINVVTNFTGTDAAGVLSKSLFVNKADVALTYGLSNGSIAGATTILVGVDATAASVTAAKASITSGAGATGSTFTLTTGVDGGTAFTGTSGNDTFNAGNVAFTALDTINGGTGTDTLNIIGTAGFTTPVAATVTSIENINVTVAGGATVFNTTTYVGTTALNATNVTGAGAMTLTAAGTTAITASNATPAAATTIDGGSSVNATVTGAAATSLITIGATTAATGAVTVNQTYTTAALAASGGTAAAPTGHGVIVTGGTTVNVTETVGKNTTNGNTANLGAVSVIGNALTTSVTATQSAAVTAAVAVANGANATNAVAATSGVVNGTVTVADVNAGSTTLANTIAAVTLANYGNSTVTSTALNTVTLSGTGGTLGLTEGGSTATVAANKTLTANLGGGSLGVITDASNQFSAVNAVMGANTTLAGITDTALRTVNLSGTGVLTLTAVNTAITSITEVGAAGLNADLSGLTGLTSINTSASTGANTLTLNAATQAFTGGAGADIVTIAADATKAIVGGAGVNTLVLNANATAFTAANTVANVTGFTTLGTAGASQGTYDLSVLTGFNAIDVRASEAAALIFDKVAAGTALQLGAATTAVTYKLAGTSGASSSVAVNLKGTTVTAANGGGTAGFTTTALTLSDQNGIGAGTVSINSDASVFQGLHIITTLTDSALSNLAITGTGSLTITNVATTSTALSISDNGTGTSTTADGIGTLTSTGNVLGALDYSGTHAFTIGTLTNNVVNATITNANTGTTGVLTIGAHTDANLASLTLNGSVALTGTYALNGAATVSGATDNAAVSLTMTGGGIKTITLGNGGNTVTTGAAADVITVGTGANTINAGAGADKITFGTHTGVDSVALLAVTNAGAALGGDTGAFTVPTANTVSTTAFDVITGLKLGDTIQLAAAAYNAAAGAGNGGLVANGTTASTLIGLTLVDNGVEIVRGTYTATGNTFVGSATGADSMFVYDSNATATGGAIGHEAIVLVGYVAASVTGIGGANGLITLG